MSHNYVFETLISTKGSDRWHQRYRTHDSYESARKYVSNDVDYPYANVVLEDVDRWLIYNGDELIKTVCIRLVKNALA